MRIEKTNWTRIGMQLGCFAVAGLVLLLQEAAAAEGHWVTAWGCGPQLTEAHNLPPAVLSHSTLRQYVHATQEGSVARVRLSNAYGTEPVPIRAAHIALAAGAGSAGNGEIDPATDTPLTFGGAPGTVIPPGAIVYSDPVRFSLPATADVAISIFFGSVSESIINGHPGARATSFILAGNKVADVNMAGSATTPHWYNITGLEVLADQSSHSVVILGDSITDGYGTGNGNERWPDFLARRISTNAPTAGVSVVNMGIGGGTVVSGGLGPPARYRFERDVLQQNGVRWLIVFIGVNDIGGSQSAENLISYFTDFANDAHSNNILVYGATITPFGGSGYDTPEHRATRQTVNEWIRTNSVYDVVIDFDAALRDPSNPEYLMPAYNNDYLHPDIDGYEALGNAVDLNLFTP